MIKPLQKNQRLLDDIRRSDLGVDQWRLWWLGQSGFLIKWNDRYCLLDPYLSDSLTKKYSSTDKPHIRMTERVITPESLDFINVVTSSHNHTDHLDAETLIPLIHENPNLTILIPEANRTFIENRLQGNATRLVGLVDGSEVEVDGFRFTGIPAAHEDLEVDQQGRHHYMGYVICFGEWCFYHSGDTLLFDGLIERLRCRKIDVSLLPINGRNPKRRVAGNLDGRQAARLAKEAGTRIVVPCHYDMFTFNTASPDAFIAECKQLNQTHYVMQNGEGISSDSFDLWSMKT